MKQYIIKYHDDLKANIDVENQIALLPVEKKLTECHDGSKAENEQTDEYNELKKEVDYIYKQYLAFIKKVEEICEKNLNLLNKIYSTKTISAETTIDDIFKNESYTYCAFLNNNVLNKSFRNRNKLHTSFVIGT